MRTERYTLPSLTDDNRTGCPAAEPITCPLVVLDPSLVVNQALHELGPSRLVGLHAPRSSSRRSGILLERLTCRLKTKHFLALFGKKGHLLLPRLMLRGGGTFSPRRCLCIFQHWIRWLTSWHADSTNGAENSLRQL